MTSLIDPSVEGDFLKGTISLCIGYSMVNGKSSASASES
jgi:hypothetical protein